MENNSNLNRLAQLSRTTGETTVRVHVNLDGAGTSELNTGIGFFDHMLALFARHGGLDLTVAAQGDLQVDGHHTVEDVGIVIGKAISEALGDKKGITRYGHSYLPMDETLAFCALDISGRPFLVFSADFTSDMVGEFATELAEEFFRAVSVHAGITLHMRCEYGTNNHHKIEALFKAFGRAFRQAVSIDLDFADEIPSTKGILE